MQVCKEDYTEKIISRDIKLYWLGLVQSLWRRLSSKCRDTCCVDGFSFGSIQMALRRRLNIRRIVVLHYEDTCCVEGYSLGL